MHSPSYRTLLSLTKHIPTVANISCQTPIERRKVPTKADYLASREQYKLDRKAIIKHEQGVVPCDAIECMHDPGSLMTHQSIDAGLRRETGRTGTTGE